MPQDSQARADVDAKSIDNNNIFFIIPPYMHSYIYKTVKSRLIINYHK